MKKILFLALIAIAFALPAKVTLSQAMANAWRLNRGLQNQLLEEQAVSTSKLTALKQKNFSVYFNGSYRYSTDQIEIKASDFPFATGSSSSIAPETILLSAPEDNFDLKMSLIQPIFNGGVLSNALKAEVIREGAEQHLTRLKRIEVAGKVKISYFNYRLLGKKSDSLKFFLENLNLHLNKLENYFREELVKKTDLLETRTKIDETKIILEDLNQQREAEKINFKNLCGYDADDIDGESGETTEEFTAAWDFFKANHPLLRSLDERARIFEVQKKSIAGSYLPQINAFADLHYGRPGQNFFKNEWTFYVQGGLSVAMPVFNWNKGGRDRTLVDIAAQKLRNQRDEFVEDTEKNLRQLYLYRETLEKKLRLLDNLVGYAAEDAQLKEKLYEANQIDHTDYLAALTGHERYLVNREEILVQMELLKVNIHVLIGKGEEEK